MSEGPKSGERTIQVAVTGEEQVGADRPEPTGDVLIAGRYRVQRRIGKGGMGEVMAARDEQIGREVAIKRMRAANPSERAIQRFLREASVQGRLEHPAIVPVHEIGRDSDGLPFFVMKKLSGTPLVEAARGRATSRCSACCARSSTSACASSSRTFAGSSTATSSPTTSCSATSARSTSSTGASRRSPVRKTATSPTSAAAAASHATGAGTAIGTPGYMAPEQVRGKADIDARADVYALGCLLFEILAGEPLHPRGFEGLESALASHETRPSVRAPEREIPPELEAIVVDATALDREARFRPRVRSASGSSATSTAIAMSRGARRWPASTSSARARSSMRRGERRAVMREATAALALDPALAGAAELVGRLMLEPPRETPPEVARRDPRG